MVEARNQLDSLVYSTEKTFEEHKEKLAPDAIGEIERGLEGAKKALESDDLTEVQKATETLSQASHKLAEVMYEGAGGPAQAAQPGGPQADAASAGAAGDDEVIDAEYVDADEK